MAKVTVQGIDPKSRIVIPQDIRTLENLTFVTKSIDVIMIGNNKEIK